jgi:glutathione S-transferase
VFVFEYLVKPALLGIHEQDAAALAKGTELFNRAAAVLDAQLKGRKYVTGDTLTLADFALGAPLIYADAVHLPLAPYGEINRWYATLAALPSWQKTLAQCTMRPAATAA